MKTSGCPHCRRAEAALRAAGVAFVEVDVSSPDGVVRDAAAKASGARTVPQVFVGGACLGGADDTIALLESGGFAARVAIAVREKKDALPPSLASVVRAVSGRVSSAREEASEGASGSDPSAPALRTTANANYAVLDDATVRMSLDLKPRNMLTFGGWRHPIRIERRAVGGGDVAAWIGRDAALSNLRAEYLARTRLDLRENEGFAVDSDAAAASVIARIGQEMVEHGFLSSADGTSAFDVSIVRNVGGAGSIPFRIADHACAPSAWPDVRKPIAALNARRRYLGPARDARVVASDLRRRILTLHDAFLSEDGTFVDYAAMRVSASFREYESVAAELQNARVSTLPRAEKMAFFINVYNALVVHVTCVAGPSVSFLDRLSYFNRHAYDVGGARYTCDDIEHGCLRGNKPGAVSLGAVLGHSNLSRGPFDRPEDPRRANAIVPPDPRVHFALVCGAKSCPPIRLYDGVDLEKQLAAAAAAFTESETKIETGSGSVSVSTSPIVGEWYKFDFGPDDASRIAALASYAGEDTPLGRELRRASETPGVRLASNEYDWSLNGRT